MNRLSQVHRSAMWAMHSSHLTGPERARGFGVQESTCIAFDLMSANLADLPELPKLLPALKLLFKDESEQAEEDEKTITG